MVSGCRVLPRAAPARQRSLPVRLQRRASRSSQAAEPEGLHDSPAAVLRSLPEGRARAGLDGEGRPLYRTRADGVVEPEGPVAPIFILQAASGPHWRATPE